MRDSKRKREIVYYGVFRRFLPLLRTRLHYSPPSDALCDKPDLAGVLLEYIYMDMQNAFQRQELLVDIVEAPLFLPQ